MLRAELDTLFLGVEAVLVATTTTVVEDLALLHGAVVEPAREVASARPHVSVHAADCYDNDKNTKSGEYLILIAIRYKNYHNKYILFKKVLRVIEK